MTESALRVRDAIVARPGITYKALCRTIGWRSVSVREQARLGGFAFISVKPSGGLIRYYPAPDGAAVAVYAPAVRTDLRVVS